MSALAPRVGQLVRLLGSDKEGKIINAAHALGRTLKAHGHDWHDLAEIAERHLEMSTPRSASSKSTRPSWQMLAQECLHQGGAYRLKQGERQFLVSMSNWTVEPSERQWAWLRAIANALGVEWRAAA
jgi:hypothetical protein